MNSVLPPLHESELIYDYITSRYFTGFELRRHLDRVALFSEDGTVISLLRRASFAKTDDETIEIDVLPLIKKRVALKSAIRDLRFQYEPEALDLMEVLNTLHAYSDPLVKQRLSDGYAMYADLPVLLPRGTEIICNTQSGDQGGIVESCVEVSSVFGSYYKIAIAVVMPTSKGCAIAKVYFKIADFPNKIAVDKLSVRPITNDQKQRLAKRGRIFTAFASHPTPATYSGKITIPSWMRDRILGADGRVMVDALNFSQVDADLYQEMMQNIEIDDNSIGTTITESDLWRTYNRVQGFSMRLKRWGWLDVEGLQPVKWRTDAFDQLVLAPTYKQTLLSLVKHAGSSFTDFIDGKSGGLVFLLNGPTGAGKTLTAEAVAETLQRPLYPISVGELGTEPSELEERLRSVLDLACQWNAVLLLDEADIYMEARDTNNIQRNAMVSIFLRLLEYYSGVLFLTTNRVRTFDPAFFSRISLAITYPRLDVAERYSVWHNILTSAQVPIDHIDLAQLAASEVNGRNIKNAVRIAQTLASADGRTVNQEDLLNVLALTDRFTRDLA